MRRGQGLNLRLGPGKGEGENGVAQEAVEEEGYKTTEGRKKT